MVSLLIVTAFLLYADRKVWAAVQMRRGPNVVGPWGLLQSFADLLKFVFKEVIIPDGANKGVFIIAPLVTAPLSLAAWAVIPLDEGWAIADINVGILYLFAISSFASMASSWAAGRRTRNIPSCPLCVRRRKWSLTKSRSASSSSRSCSAPARST